MTEGTIVAWLKAEGETVKAQEPLLVVETDKVTLEVESPASGILLKILHQAGSTLPLETVLAYIGDPTEDLPPLGSVSDAAITVSRESAPSPAAVESSAPQDRSQPTAPIKVSPIAKKLAAQHQLDLSQIKGSGPEGRIVEADIQRALQERTAKIDSNAWLSSAIPYEDTPLNNLRKTTALRMEKSFSSIPHFYLKSKVNFQPIIALRHQLEPDFSAEDLHLTYTDFLLFAAAQTLLQHPLMNAHKLNAESTRLFKSVGLGFAVAIEDGLVVPVIHQAEKLTLKEICRQRTDLAQKAKQKTLSLQEMQAATFTVSNLGMYGIEEFYPIINPPQSAILAVGSITDQPVLVGDSTAWQPFATLVLAVDHRVADGVDAARFLQDLRHRLEKADWN